MEATVEAESFLFRRDSHCFHDNDLCLRGRKEWEGGGGSLRCLLPGNVRFMRFVNHFCMFNEYMQTHRHTQTLADTHTYYTHTHISNNII